MQKQLQEMARQHEATLEQQRLQQVRATVQALRSETWQERRCAPGSGKKYTAETECAAPVLRCIANGRNDRITTHLSSSVDEE